MTTLPPDRRRWSIVLFLMGICFISHFNRISMAVAGDEKIMNGFGISPDEMGLVYSGFLIVYTVFMTLGGYFIDRFGVRIALGTAVIVSGLLEAVTGWLGLTVTLAGDFLIGLFIVRSLMGLVTTPLHPACAQAVSNWMPENHRTTANGLVTGAALFGIALTYPLFGRLIDLFHWQRAFVLSGVATMLLGAAWVLWAADGPGEPIPRGRKSSGLLKEHHSLWYWLKLGARALLQWLKLLANPSLLFLTLGYSAVGYFQYLFFYWIHYYFADILHLGKDQSRWYATIPIVAMGISMPVGGWISDRIERRYGRRFGRKVVPLTGMILSAAFLGLGLAAKQPSIMVAWFAGAFAALGTAEGPFWLTAIELGKGRGGSTAAIVNTGGNGIGLLAPLFTPRISESLGWKWGIGIGGLVAIFGAFCWLPIRIPSGEKTNTQDLPNV